jgi:hypothetical protein
MFRKPLSLLAVGLAAVGIIAAVPAASAEAAIVPPTPHGLTSAIEPMTSYVGQTSCDPHTWAGTRALAQLLARTYRADGATSYNTVYACGTDGSQSEHYDGRAIDWMTSVRNSHQRAAANAAIKWLLATDKAGNRFAMARRLGVMYIIWNNRMWGSWDGRWEDYNGCSHLKSRANDNACHRTHVHLSLSWNGAMKRTSYWTGHVSDATDYGPCIAAGQNWAYLYTRPNYSGCAWHRTVHAKKGASALKKTLVTYSGAAVRMGWSGPAVTAVQRALHVPATGRFGATTRTAVKRFQSAHHHVATGSMNTPTWTSLLAAVH